MATITPTIPTSGAYLLTATTLGASDTLTVTGGRQILTLHNSTGGSLTVKIDGADGTTVTVDGIGAVDVSAGYDIVLAAGVRKQVKLSTIREYLKGVVTLTGGTGVTATLVNE